MRPAIAVCCAVLFVVAAGLAGRGLTPLTGASVDFAEYAAAARVLQAGGNMYDAQSLLGEQLPVGLPGKRPGTDKLTPDAIMMWNPPWVTPIVLPLAWVGWGPGFAAWIAIEFVAVMVSVGLMWRMFGGPPRGLLVTFALTLVYPASIYLLYFGQITGLMLLGVAGFAAALRAGRPGVAGLALALTAIKPHLLFTFAALVAADALYRAPVRRAVLVGVLVLVGCALVPLAYRPGVWGEYVTATGLPTDDYHVAPADWDPPILAGVFAKQLDNSTAAKFAPSIVATLIWLGVWWRDRRTWDWAERVPAVILTCLLTTGYGAWVFDLVLNLVALVWVAARLGHAGGRLAFYFATVYLAAVAIYLLTPFPALLVTPSVGVFVFAAWWVTRPGTSPGVAAV